METEYTENPPEPARPDMISDSPPGRVRPTRWDGSEWSKLSTRRRCAIVGGVAAEIAGSADRLVALCRSDQRQDDAETVASELLPLAASLRFVGRHGPRILRPRRLGWVGRPGWLWGVRHEVRRVPWGRVLILGTWNYPLLLPGVQTAQALAAGNDVWLKPAAGTEAAAACMAERFYAAGVPRSTLRLLDSDPRSAIDAIDGGVELVVLTGAAATGRKVMTQAASTLTPVIMELSGCDAVIALGSADPERVAAAIDFGLHFNAGATCIGPRRLIAEPDVADAVLAALDRKLDRKLDRRLSSRPTHRVHAAARESASQMIDKALATGAVDRRGRYDGTELRDTGLTEAIVLDRVPEHAEIGACDLFAPVLSVHRVDSIDSAAGLVNRSPYRLAASVFGEPNAARRVADALAVGTVTVNDLIVPTADPRVPFGGRGESGFGVTRGPEGLLAMTAVKVVGERRGRFAPHLSASDDSDVAILRGYLTFRYAASFAGRMSGLRQMIAGVKTSRRKVGG